MSDRRTVIVNHNPQIDWESVYLAFEKRFIDTHYEPWRRQFNQDAVDRMCETTPYRVGQIIPYWLKDFPLSEKVIYQVFHTYYDAPSNFVMVIKLLLCNGQDFDPEVYPDLMYQLDDTVVPELHTAHSNKRPILYPAFRTEIGPAVPVDYQQATGQLTSQQQLPSGTEDWMDNVLYHDHKVTPIAGTKVA